MIERHFLRGDRRGRRRRRGRKKNESFEETIVTDLCRPKETDTVRICFLVPRSRRTGVDMCFPLRSILHR